MAERLNPRAGAHPTAFTYIRVATLLAILTAVEVAVFYVDALKPAFLPIFLILSVAKFALVVMFYMHLKFDSRLFSGMLVGGLMLAVSVAIVLMGLFQVISATANTPEGMVGVPHEDEEATPEPVEPTPVPSVTEAPDATVPPTPVGPPTTPPVAPGLDGQALFMTVPDNVAPQALWCSTCHQIEGVSAGLIGPDLTHIGTDAATRKPGMSAAEYIAESIRDPDGFICPLDVPRCGTPGLMTDVITEKLTDDQVDALVEYLLQQK